MAWAAWKRGPWPQVIKKAGTVVTRRHEPEQGAPEARLHAHAHWVRSLFENLSGAGYPLEFHMVGVVGWVWTVSENGNRRVDTDSWFSARCGWLPAQPPLTWGCF